MCPQSILFLWPNESNDKKLQENHSLPHDAQMDRILDAIKLPFVTCVWSRKAENGPKSGKSR